MHIALIDGGSLVMPYNHFLIKALQEDGIAVSYFGSETSFNGEYLDAVRDLDDVSVTTRNISSSTVGNPVTRAWGYVSLLLTVLFQARRFDLIVLEFTPAGYLETLFAWFVRRKFVFVMHNVVPHDSHAPRHGSYAAIMRQAREVWCVSRDTARRAREAYPECAGKMRVVQHGKMGCTPDAPPRSYEPPEQLSDLLFWGSVKPYKGIDRLLSAQHENVKAKVFSNIEIHGRWSSELGGLKAKFVEAGAHIKDAFLSAEEVTALLQRDALFVLPYHAASQSGVLFTLMYHGRYFVASDVGEIGRMLRSMDLECLLMDNFDLPSLQAKASWIVDNGDWICSRMCVAAELLGWDDAPKAARDLVKGLAETE